MEGSNILSGSLDTLNDIKENLLEKHGYQAKYDSMVIEEENLEKSIHSLEKEIADEIASTTKKRRQEIEDTFDQQMDKIKGRIKKTKEKRDKRKNSKVSERIQLETAYLREENKELRQEAKDVFRQNHIPRFANSKLFYALYLPGMFTDFLLILISLLLTLLIIPCGVYFLFLPKDTYLFLILDYVITVVFFGGLYITLDNRIKDKHINELKQVKELRKKIRNNNKKAHIISKNIKKDRDESTYGLEGFDEELSKLEKEMAEVAEQRKAALSIFDNSTSPVISAEIKARSEDKLKGLQSQYEKVRAEVAVAQEKVKQLTIKIASEYEPYLGKDFMTLDRLESLINIIQAGSAANISEALTFYQKSLNNNGQKLLP